MRSTDSNVSKAEIRPLPNFPCSRPYTVAHCTRSSITDPQFLDALCHPPVSLTSSHPLHDAAPLLWLVTLVSSSFLENAKLASLRGHLHWLFLLLRTLFPISFPGTPFILQNSTSFVFCPLNSIVGGCGGGSSHASNEPIYGHRLRVQQFHPIPTLSTWIQSDSTG